jgi:hypothetical protein
MNLGPGISTRILVAYTNLIRVYVFAEKVKDTPTKNTLMLEIFYLMDVENTTGRTRGPDVNAIVQLYAGTSGGNLFRKLLVELWFRQDRAPHDDYQHAPAAFHVGLMRRNELDLRTLASHIQLGMSHIRSSRLDYGVPPDMYALDPRMVDFLEYE